MGLNPHRRTRLGSAENKFKFWMEDRTPFNYCNLDEKPLWFGKFRHCIFLGENGSKWTSHSFVAAFKCTEDVCREMSLDYDCACKGTWDKSAPVPSPAPPGESRCPWDHPPTPPPPPPPSPSPPPPPPPTIMPSPPPPPPTGGSLDYLPPPKYPGHGKDPAPHIGESRNFSPRFGAMVGPAEGAFFFLLVHKSHFPLM